MEKINSLTGMLDLISNKSDNSELANKIFLTEKHLKNIFQNYGMSEIRTPALEDTNLFKRSVGDASDIVNKELYSFNDKNDKNIVLRPEGTAGVIRAIIQKKIDLEVHKFWYMGPMWRYERPQKGRYRQFYQAGVEILGHHEGLPEFEMISLVCSINQYLQIDKPIIKINHLGDNKIKELYCEDLVKYLSPLKSKLDEKDQNRLKKNPLRILDSKSETTQNILKDAPKINNYISNSSKMLLDEIIKTFSSECSIQIDSSLVRGLDYYTGFVFEAVSDDLGAQNAYLGGGRYDNLCSQLGGKNLPAIGMAIGLERLSILVNAEEASNKLLSFIILSEKINPKAYKIAHDLRLLNENVKIDIQLSEGSLKSKLRRASKDNADYALILGDQELESETVIVKSLKESNSEQKSMTIDELNGFIPTIS